MKHFTKSEITYPTPSLSSREYFYRAPFGTSETIVTSTNFPIPWPNTAFFGWNRPEGRQKTDLELIAAENSFDKQAKEGKRPLANSIVGKRAKINQVEKFLQAAKKRKKK